jgi:PHD/YefM family antitoxin component YafN of YafNO toxin-antitoxin module
MTIFAGSSIPRIDPSVEHVGVSRLRKLNSDDLKSMDKTLVLQENDQPLAVLLTYEKFLILQDQLDSLMRTIYVLSNQDESAALRSAIEDVNKGRTRDINQIKAELHNKKK